MGATHSHVCRAHSLFCSDQFLPLSVTLVSRATIRAFDRFVGSAAVIHQQADLQLQFESTSSRPEDDVYDGKGVLTRCSDCVFAQRRASMTTR